MSGMIYTSNGSLVVERVIWSGVSRYIKSAGGKFERFYRIHSETTFRKTGWGKRAERDFYMALDQVKKEIYK